MEKKIAKITKKQIEILDRMDLFLAHFTIHKQDPCPCIRLTGPDFELFDRIYDPSWRRPSTNQPDVRTLDIEWKLSDYVGANAWHYQGIPVISNG